MFKRLKTKIYCALLGGGLGISMIFPSAAFSAGCDDLPKVMGANANTGQIRCALKQSRAQSMTRGIAIVDKKPVVAAVSFAIEFEFGSARLTLASQKLLATVAQAIEGDEGLRKAAYFIDGHTDAVGSEASNMKLALARAQAATGFLLTRLDKPLTVKVRSFGESHLLQPNNPRAAVNRRVEISPVAAE